MSTNTVWLFEEQMDYVDYCEEEMPARFRTKAEIPAELLERYASAQLDFCRVESELYSYYEAAKLKQSSTEHEQGKSENKL